MKSITIHGIDADLNTKIMEKCQEYGLSQNRTVKQILKDSLSADQKDTRKSMFLDLFGKWTEKEKDDFDRRISDLETTHEADWKDDQNIP